MKHISKVSVVKANTNTCDDTEIFGSVIVGFIADPMTCIKEIIGKATATQ
jgi:hypothetical protein